MQIPIPYAQESKNKPTQPKESESQEGIKKDLLDRLTKSEEKENE